MIKMDNLPETTNDRLLMNLDHEIRTSTNTILGMMEVLSESHLNFSQKKYLNVTRISAAHLVKRSSEILDLLAIESGTLTLKAENFSLRDKLEHTVELMADLAGYKGVNIHLDISKATFGTMSGDPDRVQQILVTLLRAAIDRMNAGEITLCVRCDTTAAEIVELHFSISCSGVLEPEPRLSDAETASLQPHCDVDLMLSQGLAKMMNGSLCIGTGPAEPTFSFTMQLAFVEAEQSLRHSEKVITFPAKRTIKILIAEDAADNLLLIEAYLKDGPYSIDSAVNGRVAVDKAMEGAYDLILMDLDMPLMDGRTATRMIRVWECLKEKPAVPIVALTAYSQPGSDLKSVQAGCTAHITKPIRKAALIETIQKYAISGSLALA
jgi:CheY-like chemotaxis protein